MRSSDWSSDVCSSDLDAIISWQGPRRRKVARPAMRAPSRAWEAREAGLKAEKRLQLQATPCCSRKELASSHRRPKAGPLPCAGTAAERRVGKKCGRESRSRWPAYHKQKNNRKD